MGVGGQHHASVALPPGMTRYPLNRRLGGPQGRSGWKSCPHRNYFFVKIPFIHVSDLIQCQFTCCYPFTSFTIYTFCFSSSSTFTFPTYYEIYFPYFSILLWFSMRLFILLPPLLYVVPFSSRFFIFFITAPTCDSLWVSLLIVSLLLVVHRLWRLALVSVVLDSIPEPSSS